jgi:hypothetical protein
MKKLFFATLFGAGLLLGASTVQAQHFYVSVHPSARVIVRPRAPSPRHVWIGSEWTWSGGRYVERPGYWALPPRGRRAWVSGRWVNDRRGNYWVGGRWR